MKLQSNYVRFSLDDFDKCKLLRSRRIALKLTLLEAANLLGITSHKLSRYELGSLVYGDRQLISDYDQLLTNCENGSIQFNHRKTKAHSDERKTPCTRPFNTWAPMAANQHNKIAPDYVIQNISDLYDERKCRNLSKQELSEKAGISCSVYAALENMSVYPRPYIYNKLAKVLGWKSWRI